MCIKNYNYLIKKVPDFKDDLLKLCKKDQYNIMLNYHIGDTFVTMSFYKELQESLQKPIHFFVNPSQEIVMKLYNYKNYTIINLDNFINPYIKKYFKNKIKYEYFKFTVFEHFFKDELCLNIPILISSNRILCSNIIKQYGKSKNFLQGWAYQLGLNIEKVDFNINYPTLSEEAENKIKIIAPLNKIVLFAPEARSDYMFDKKFWNILAKKIMQQGFIIIENITNQENHIEGAINIDLKLEDVIALGYSCHSVFAIRSGLTDVLAGKGKDLYVLYRKERWNDGYYSFRKFFNIKDNNYPNEIILDEKLQPKLIWNNIDLLNNISKKLFYISYLEILKIHKLTEKLQKHWKKFIFPIRNKTSIVCWFIQPFSILFYIIKIIIKILLNFWRLF